jgi:hypothetical protein
MQTEQKMPDIDEKNSQCDSQDRRLLGK